MVWLFLFWMYKMWLCPVASYKMVREVERVLKLPLETRVQWVNHSTGVFHAGNTAIVVPQTLVHEYRTRTAAFYWNVKLADVHSYTVQTKFVWAFLTLAMKDGTNRNLLIKNRELPFLQRQLQNANIYNRQAECISA